MEQPVGGDLSPDGCWDGSNAAGNRGVCMFEERDSDKWGPRKFSALHLVLTDHGATVIHTAAPVYLQFLEMYCSKSRLRIMRQ